MRITIIGDSGRFNSEKMDRSLYDKMYTKVDRIMEEYYTEGASLHLVSGGLAWAEHIAVQMFLEGMVDSLTLYFPVAWNDGIFFSRGPNKPGKLINAYHKKFGKVLGRNTHKDIAEAISIGAKVISPSGKLTGPSNRTYLRNNYLADVDTLITMTWEDGRYPVHGSVGYTWRNSKAKKIHIPLGSL
jgi:hypothetical protein